MYDRELVLGCLEEIGEALRRIERRFQGVNSAEFFEASDEGLDRLDSIAMMLVWLGESIKRLDRLGASELLKKHPGVDWKGTKGMRDILSHDYGRADAEAVYAACVSDVPAIRNAVTALRIEIERGARS